MCAQDVQHILQDARYRAGRGDAARGRGSSEGSSSARGASRAATRRSSGSEDSARGARIERRAPQPAHVLVVQEEDKRDDQVAEGWVGDARVVEEALLGAHGGRGVCRRPGPTNGGCVYVD